MISIIKSFKSSILNITKFIAVCMLKFMVYINVLCETTKVKVNYVPRKIEKPLEFEWQL